MTLLTRKKIYKMIIDELLIKYPDAVNGYEAMKLHLNELRKKTFDINTTEPTYDALIAEILYFDWMVTNSEIVFLKKCNVSVN